MVSMNQLNAFGSNLDEMFLKKLQHNKMKTITTVLEMFKKTPTQQDEDDNNGT
jgi:hypothetical protein